MRGFRPKPESDRYHLRNMATIKAYPAYGMQVENVNCPGPNGQKRPADAIGAAVLVGRIATDDEQDAAAECSGRRKSGIAGAKARRASLSEEERSEIAKRAAQARWKD